MRRLQRTKKNKKISKTRKIKFLSLISFILLILASSVYFLKPIAIKKINSTSKVTATTTQQKAKHEKNKTADGIPDAILNSANETTDSQNKDLRKFPYPYNAMLAICSDIDDATIDEFKNYHKFLNTKEQTPYGDGLGLDIGDSMWMYMADNVNYKVDAAGNGVDTIMTFFKGIDGTTKHNADEMVGFINAGWIDTIHTFGDFSTKNEKGTSFNRDLAQNAWDTLKSINFKPTVWINHGNKSNKQNFGAHDTSNFMSYQQGDNPKSNYYHTDLTLENGVKYIWNSLGDYNFGHDYPLYEISLRDGKKVWGFYRYTNNLVNNKIDWTWTPKHLHRQLTEDNLNNLVKNNYYSIVGQHLGINTEDLFTEENIKSLKLLKQYEVNNKILVSKTSRLLNYANMHKYVMYNKVVTDDKTCINITAVNDPIFGKQIPTIDNIRGLTFYCENPDNTLLLLNKNIINQDELQINPKDETGKASISIKWFKPDYTNYIK